MNGNNDNKGSASSSSFTPTSQSNNNCCRNSSCINCIVEYYKKFHIGVILDVINLCLSLACIVVWVYTDYHPNTVLRHEKKFFWFNFSSRAFFVVDFFLLQLPFKAWTSRTEFVKDLLFEMIGIVPYFLSRITVGAHEDLTSIAHIICSSLVCFRIFKLLSFGDFFLSDVNRSIFQLLCKLICLLLSGSVFLNVVENTQTIGKYYMFLPRDCDDESYNCNGVNDSILSTLLFVATTISTIGYYSTIESIPGKCINIVLILIAVVVVGVQCYDLMKLIMNKSVYARTSYKKVKGVDFILITGNISDGSMEVVLQEYFHEDHGVKNRHALILCAKSPSDDMKALIQKYQNKLFYLEGSPTQLNDLQRCEFQDANTIMLFCNKLSEMHTGEDSTTLLTAMRIKKHLDKAYPRDERSSKSSTTTKDSHHNVANNNNNTTANSKRKKNVLTTSKELLNTANNEMKENTHNERSGSMSSEGAIPDNCGDTNRMISKNQNTNEDNSNNNNNNNNASSKVIKKHKGPQFIMQILAPESEQKSALTIEDYKMRYQVLCIEELKLSLMAKSCLCRGFITLISNLVITNNFDDNMINKIGDYKWLSEYKHGKDYEIYKIRLNNLRGYRFSTCVQKIYEEKKIILFGLGLESPFDKSVNHVLLSPMDFVLPKEKELNVYGYLLAKDQEDADSVVEWTTHQPKPSFLPQTVNRYTGATTGVKGKRGLRYNDEENILDVQLNTAANAGNALLNETLSLANAYHVTTNQTNKEDATMDRVDHMIIARNHIIICGVCQNLFDFVKPLRAKYLPKDKMPTIVILSKESLEDKIWNSISLFEKIYLVKGDPESKNDLIRAGVKYARSVVVLSPTLKEIEHFVDDLKLKQRLKLGNTDSNVRPNIDQTYIAKQIESELDMKTSLKYNDITKLKSDVFCLVELVNPKNADTLRKYSMREHDDFALIRENLGIDSTAAFASGEVYCSNIMDNVVVQAYYNPSLLNVLKKLIIGDQQNNSLKKTVLEKYSRVASGNLYLIDMPMNLFEESSTHSNGDSVMFEQVFNIMLQKKMIVIGVYREGNLLETGKSEGMSIDVRLTSTIKTNIGVSNKDMNYYVVTAPEQTFQVNARDKLFVISTEYPSEEMLLTKDNDKRLRVGIDVDGEDELIDNDPINGLKVHNKKFDEKKDWLKEIDEEGETKLKMLNNEMKETFDLIHETASLMKKTEETRDMIIKEGIQSKLGSLFKLRGNKNKK